MQHVQKALDPTPFMSNDNINDNENDAYKSNSYLDRRVVGSFMTITSVISPNLLK